MQADAGLFIVVELIRLSDHHPMLQQQEKPLGRVLACGVDVCSNFELSGDKVFFK